MQGNGGGPSRVLHAIVGHKLPVYFLNAVNSVRLMTENDDILVVDNASGLPGLISELQSIAEREPRVRLLLRDTNDISRNSKVGGLYDAYNEVVDYALDRGYDYLHIIQHDMQMVWWDETVIDARGGDLRGVPGVREHLDDRAGPRSRALRRPRVREAEAGAALALRPHRHRAL